MKKRGFSLIEVLIASMIFSLVMITATSIFLSSNRVQGKTQISRDLVKQTRFAIETMLRDIRMAKSYQLGPAQYQIQITTHDDKTINYSLENNAIEVTRDNVTKKLTDATKILVKPGDLIFSSASDPKSSSNKVQPYIKVEIAASPAQPDRSATESQLIYKLQTTVSLRNYVKSY